MKKCLVIYNPNSGKHNMEEILPKIKKLLNNYNYEVKIGLNRYRLKFKSKKTEIWNDYDGNGEIKYTFIQLKEEDK